MKLRVSWEKIQGFPFQITRSRTRTIFSRCLGRLNALKNSYSSLKKTYENYSLLIPSSGSPSPYSFR